MGYLDILSIVYIYGFRTLEYYIPYVFDPKRYMGITVIDADKF